MAIDTILPVQSSVIDPGDTVSFLVDDTWTTLTIQVQTSSGLESAFSGVAQPGYTVSVTNAAGRDTFIVSRNAGWDKSPQQVIVTEDESGGSTQTTLSWVLSSESIYPTGHQPYNSVTQGDLTVSEGDVVVRQDVGQLDFDNATFNLTDLGPGKVLVTGLGAGGNAKHVIHESSLLTISDSTNWYSWAIANGYAAENWNTLFGAHSGDPTLNRYNNGWYIPANGTVLSVQIGITISSVSNFDLKFELWKIAQTDGDTSDGTKTKVASTNWSTGIVGNQLHLKTFTLDAASLSANDMLVIYGGKTDASGAAACRFGITLVWEES